MAAPPAAVTVLRLRADAEGRWVDALPPVPAGQLVTVSTTSPAPAALARLTGRGYVYVGELADPLVADRPVVDVVVPTPLAETEPAWWRAATGQAEAVHTLLHGPVALLFGRLVALHRAVATGESR